MRFWLLYVSDGSAVCECGWAGGLGGVGVGSQALEQGVDSFWIFFFWQRTTEMSFWLLSALFFHWFVWVFFFVFMHLSICAVRELSVLFFFVTLSLPTSLVSVAASLCLCVPCARRICL